MSSSLSSDESKFFHVLVNIYVIAIYTPFFSTNILHRFSSSSYLHRLLSTNDVFPVSIPQTLQSESSYRPSIHLVPRQASVWIVNNVSYHILHLRHKSPLREHRSESGRHCLRVIRLCKVSSLLFHNYPNSFFSHQRQCLSSCRCDSQARSALVSSTISSAIRTTMTVLSGTYYRSCLSNLKVVRYLIPGDPLLSYSVHLPVSYFGESV